VSEGNVTTAHPVDAMPPRRHRGPETWLPAIGRATNKLFGSTASTVAVAMLTIIVVLAVFGPLVWTKDPRSIDLANKLVGPSWAHPMGTDGVGRDVFARFNEGARISLVTGLAAAGVGGVLGGLIGLISGAFGGIVDATLMRCMDALVAFPPLVLAMAVTVGLGVGLVTAAIGIVLTSIPYYSRIIRADVLRVRSLNYIEAGVALGATRKRLILRHILPNVLGTTPVLVAANFGYAILTLAALGFVGLGAQIPTPEWGTMITEGQQYVLTGSWWVGLFPGLGVLIVVTATSMLADRARDVFDPRGEFARG
jgi:peptide/nickel transport system permease protein